MMKNMKMMKWSGVMEKLFSLAAVSAVCTKHEDGGAELHTTSDRSREEQHSQSTKNCFKFDTFHLYLNLTFYLD